MRELSFEEVGAVSGNGLLGAMGKATGLTGGDSGYAPTAQVYGRGIAAVVGLATFGIPGALAAVGAFSVGWAIGSAYNFFSRGGSGSSSNSSSRGNYAGSNDGQGDPSSSFA